MKVLIAPCERFKAFTQTNWQSDTDIFGGKENRVNDIRDRERTRGRES